MRTKEGNRMRSVASRIAQFELGCNESLDKIVKTEEDELTYPKTKTQRVIQSAFSPRYVDLDDIIEESSIEDENETQDSDGYFVTSHEDTSSPDTSFRASGRSSSSASEQSPDTAVCSTKRHISEKLSQKSLDSGFSDYSDSKDLVGENSSERRAELKSSVVHETHATKDSKLHHVSKVYFYSVSDLLRDNSTEFEDHLSLLKTESATDPPTPRIDPTTCENDYFERVESPFIPISNPAQESPFQRCSRIHTGTSSLRRKTPTEEDCNKNSYYLYSSESPSQSPVRRCLTPSTSPFPLTNGSLFSDLSLNRRSKDQQNRKSRNVHNSPQGIEDQTEHLLLPLESLSGSLPLENSSLGVSIKR